MLSVQALSSSCPHSTEECVEQEASKLFCLYSALLFGIRTIAPQRGSGEG